MSPFHEDSSITLELSLKRVAHNMKSGLVSLIPQCSCLKMVLRKVGKKESTNKVVLIC